MEPQNPQPTESSRQDARQNEELFQRFVRRLLLVEDAVLQDPHRPFTQDRLHEVLTGFCEIIAEFVNAESCTIHLTLYDPATTDSAKSTPGRRLRETIEGRFKKKKHFKANDPRPGERKKHYQSILTFPYWWSGKGLVRLVAANKGSVWNSFLRQPASPALLSGGTFLPLRTGVTTTIVQDKLARVCDRWLIPGLRQWKKLGNNDSAIWDNSNVYRLFRNYYGVPIQIHAKGETVGLLKLENRTWTNPHEEDRDRTTAGPRNRRRNEPVLKGLLRTFLEQAIKREFRSGSERLRSLFRNYDDRKRQEETSTAAASREVALFEEYSYLARAYLLNDAKSLSDEKVIAPFITGYGDASIRSTLPSVTLPLNARAPIQLFAHDKQSETELLKAAVSKFRTAGGPGSKDDIQTDIAAQFLAELTKHFVNSLDFSSLEEYQSSISKTLREFLADFLVPDKSLVVVQPWPHIDGEPAHFGYDITVKQSPATDTPRASTPGQDNRDLRLTCVIPPTREELARLIKLWRRGGDTEFAGFYKMFLLRPNRATRKPFRPDGEFAILGNREKRARHLWVDRMAARVQALMFSLPLPAFRPGDTRILTWAAFEIGKLIERRIAYYANLGQDPMPLTSLAFFTLPISTACFVDDLKQRRRLANEVSNHLDHHLRNLLFASGLNRNQEFVRYRSRIKRYDAYLERLGERWNGYVQGSLTMYFLLLKYALEKQARLPQSQKEDAGLFWTSDFPNAKSLVHKLQESSVQEPKQKARPFDRWLAQEAPKLLELDIDKVEEQTLRAELKEALNTLVKGALIYNEDRFKGIELRKETSDLLNVALQTSVSATNLRRLNSLLIRDAYSVEVFWNQEARDFWEALERFTSRLENAIRAVPGGRSVTALKALEEIKAAAAEMKTWLGDVNVQSFPLPEGFGPKQRKLALRRLRDNLYEETDSKDDPLPEAGATTQEWRQCGRVLTLLYRNYDVYFAHAMSLLCQLIAYGAPGSTPSYAAFYRRAYELKSVLSQSTREMEEEGWTRLAKFYLGQMQGVGTPKGNDHESLVATLLDYLNRWETREFMKRMGLSRCDYAQADNDPETLLPLSASGIFKRLRYLYDTLRRQKASSHLEWLTNRFDFVGARFTCLYRNAVFALYEQMWNQGDPFYFYAFGEETLTKFSNSELADQRARWLCVRTNVHEDEYRALQVAALADPDAIKPGHWETSLYTLSRLKIVLNALFRKYEPTARKQYLRYGFMRNVFRQQYLKWFLHADEVTRTDRSVSAADSSSDPSKAAWQFGEFLGEAVFDSILALYDEWKAAGESDGRDRSFQALRTLLLQLRVPVLTFVTLAEHYVKTVVLPHLKKLLLAKCVFEANPELLRGAEALYDAVIKARPKRDIHAEHCQREKSRLCKRKEWLIPAVWVRLGRSAQLNACYDSVNLNSEAGIYRLVECWEAIRREQKDFLFHRPAPEKRASEGLGLGWRERESVLHRIMNYVLLFNPKELSASNGRQPWKPDDLYRVDAKDQESIAKWTPYDLFYYVRSLIPVEIQIRTAFADTMAEQYHDALYKGRRRESTDAPRKRLEALSRRLSELDSEMEMDFEDYADRVLEERRLRSDSEDGPGGPRS